MALIQKFIDRIRGRKPKPIDPPPAPAGPIISTPWGNVSESARRQAALNMAADPEVKRRVEGLLMKEYGAVAGLREARRRYPEGYTKEELAQP